MGKIWKEFREFAVKGNVIDLAVGVIIGAAFSKLVDSLVKDIIMPPLGLVVSRFDFNDLRLVLKSASKPEEAVYLSYGLFINALINFLIVSFAVFVLVKQINRLRRGEVKKDPVMKECPQCASSIPAAAKRCPQCTTILPIADTAFADAVDAVKTSGSS